jgi:putative toxin-antitoxin system antitoxin component (TIGR02293 family)
MVDPARVANVLGGATVLRRRVRSLNDLSRIVEAGLPKQALRCTVQRLYSQARDVNTLLHAVVPEATYKRRDRLSLVESEKTERLARVIANAEYVWDDREEAHRWLTTAHPMLGGKTPVQASMTELGARETESLLASIFYGLPA